MNVTERFPPYSCHPCDDFSVGHPGQPTSQGGDFYYTEEHTRHLFQRMLHPYVSIPSMDMVYVPTCWLIFLREMWCKYTIHGCYGLGCSVGVFEMKNTRGK